MAYSEDARRAYWSPQFDNAYCFMSERILPYPVVECSGFSDKTREVVGSRYLRQSEECARNLKVDTVVQQVCFDSRRLPDLPVHPGFRSGPKLTCTLRLRMFTIGEELRLRH